MEGMADIFAVIADPTRRELMEALLQRRQDGGEATVSELVEQLGVPQPTVSKHLRVLRDAGLATVRERGQHRYYSLEMQPLDEVDDWLLPFVFAGSAEEPQQGLGAAAYAAWTELEAAAKRMSGKLQDAGGKLQDAARQARDRIQRDKSDD